MSDTETGDAGQSRRQFMRITAGAVGMGVGSQVLPNGPVQESEAILPAAVAGGTAAKAVAGAAGGSAAIGWTLREFEVLGSDAPAEGSTAESLKNEIYNIAQTRQSTNQSTFVDNLDILDGLEHTVYGEAKLAAIEKLNEQESQEDVLEAAQDEVDERLSNVQERLWKSWNESVQEYATGFEAASNHEEIDTDEMYQTASHSFTWGSAPWITEPTEPETHELVDGSEMEVETIRRWLDSNDGPSSTEFNLISGGHEDRDRVQIRIPERDRLEYLRHHDWAPLNDKIEDLYEELMGEVQEFVSGVYQDVQAGELDTEELLTPREQAQLTAEDEDFPQAIADLQALNIGTDLEREAEIHLPEIDAYVWGQLAYSGDDTLETGDVNPDEKEGTIYLTYDVSQGTGDWSAYEEGIDGGVLVLTQEPFPDTLYVVDTAAGETVELTADDFEDDDEEWTVDLSDDLDDAITNVEQISYYAKSDETQYETVQLQNEFEIVSFEDSDGEEYDSAEFERSEPHDDDNYISEEEWKEQQERHEELIEKYEDSGGGGLGFLDGEEIPAEGLLLIVLAIFAALFGR